MHIRTPITLITGPLGSGKTTLLRHILATKAAKIAIVMNEFGEIAIDTKVIEGKNVRIAELGGGCVCCSLLGEFEAAVKEIIEKIDPDIIVVETTGVAEPEALAFNIQEALPQCRTDGIVSVADADGLVRFADGLPASVHRAKGFVLFPDGAQLFNFVAGRWDLEPFETDCTDLVFIGKENAAQKPAILRALEACAHPDNK